MTDTVNTHNNIMAGFSLRPAYQSNSLAVLFPLKIQGGAQHSEALYSWLGKQTTRTTYYNNYCFMFNTEI